MNEPKPQHEKAHVVTRLAGDAIVGPWHEPHGTQQHVLHEPTPGVLIHARLGASGLQIIRGGTVVCYPLGVMIDHAAGINPKISEPPDKPAKLPASAPKTKK